MDKQTEARFWDKAIVTESGCIEFTGHDVHGYRQFRLNGKQPYAHRVAWELVNGPIPEGLAIDHLCRNRACIRPDHLEPVTGAENSRRGSSSKVTPQIAATILEHAKNGTDTRTIARHVGLSESTICRHIALEYIAEKTETTSLPSLRLA